MPDQLSTDQTAPATDRSTFDGVVCFGGEDWWYHNRGHFDMQIMRELSTRVPVLYVNSIGMRTPRVGEGSVFVRRIARKLKSFARGLVQFRPNFAVFSPVVPPGGGKSALAQRLLPWQVRRAARRSGIRQPLLWVACPPGAAFVDSIAHVGLVYQRTDRYEEFPGVDYARIRGFDQSLKAAADLVVFCSRNLHAEEGPACPSSLYVDHGVDYERFAEAGSEAGTVPSDVDGIPSPRVGFVGGIDAHTFDPELFLAVAGALPDVPFVMVGGCSLPDGWCMLPNVHFLGRKPYDEVADYMAACDVLIMPWNRNEWIRACNPVKLKEYLAVGRPVVSTPFDELEFYSGLVHVAQDAESFAREIRSALVEPGLPAPRRDRVRNETWKVKGRSILNELERLGLMAAPRSSRERGT